MTADQCRLRVLVVDDDADTCETTALLLKLWGFDTATACSGPEALQAALVHAPHVVLLDLAMPEMDGLQVAQLLRKQPPNGHRPFLIAMSGYGDTRMRQRSQAAGIDVHFVKPADLSELENLLRRFQRVAMPSAERRLHPGHRRLLLDTSLQHWSDRALLRGRRGSLRELMSHARTLCARFKASATIEERNRIRGEFCEQVAQLLDENVRIKQLAVSFQRWSTT